MSWTRQTSCVWIPGTWPSFRCFPIYLSRDLGRKWISWLSNWWCWHCGQWLNTLWLTPVCFLLRNVCSNHLSDFKSDGFLAVNLSSLYVLGINSLWYVGLTIFFSFCKLSFYCVHCVCTESSFWCVIPFVYFWLFNLCSSFLPKRATTTKKQILIVPLVSQSFFLLCFLLVVSQSPT